MPTARRSLHRRATSHSPLARVRIVRSGSRARSQAVTTQFWRGQSGRLWDTLVPADPAAAACKLDTCPTP
jgi:hypothetical protein